MPKEQLARANGRLLGAHMVANELVAPPLGGLLFATAAAVPFLLDAGTFAAAAALVAAMGGRFRVERSTGAAPTTLRSEIAEGVRWLLRHRLLRILAVAIALMNLTLSATLSISVLYAQERLGLGSVGYGLLISSMAVGGVAASLVAERLIGWLGPATTMRLGLIIETSTHLTLALARSPLLVGAVFALFGFHAMTWSVISVSLRQELIPARLLGRVNSAYALFGFGSLSLGAILGGLLAARAGLTAPFWCSFAAMAALTLACWPLLSSRAVAQARALAATEEGSRASGVDVGHVLGGVALAGHRPAGGDLLDRGQVVGGQLHLQGAGVLLQVAAALGPRDGHHVVAPAQHPGDRQLAGRDPLGRRQLPHPLHQLQVAAKFSPVKRGWPRRKSSSPKSSGLVIRPDRNPRPSGL